MSVPAILVGYSHTTASSYHLVLQNFVSTYLGHTSVSPLQEAFVNGPDALATGASMSVYTLSHPYAQVGFTNVDKDRMDEVEETFSELVRKQVEEDEFDLERMRDIGQSPLYFLTIASGMMMVMMIGNKSNNLLSQC